MIFLHPALSRALGTALPTSETARGTELPGPLRSGSAAIAGVWALRSLLCPQGLPLKMKRVF